MIPYTYEMVDMGGVDLADFVGNTYSGLYSRILDSLDDRLVVVLYNWRCADVKIPPAYVNISVFEHKVVINGLVEVNDDDTISVPHAQGEPAILSLEVTENGTYSAPSGVDGYSPITVEVPPPPPVVTPLSVTQNGTYTAPSGVDGYSPVSVNVPDTPSPTAELYATQNGRYDAPVGVSGYDPVIVNVLLPPPVVVPLSVTENGTYTVPSGTTGYGPVVVNVPAIQRPAVDSAYQEVEYLDFTPSIGIIVSLPSTGNFLYECAFSSDTDVADSSCAFGYRVSSSSPKDFELDVASGYFRSYMRTSSNVTGVSFGNLFQCVIGKKEIVRIVLISPRSTALVGKYAHYSSAGVDSMALDGKFYYANAIDLTTGDYAVWLVPCYRKSDNQIGVYDVIGNAFYYETYHVGSGYAITAGPDVN